MGPKIGIFGAGAVGGYVGGGLALAGVDVTLIGQWCAHVDRIKHGGLLLRGPEGERIAHPKALHLHEVQSLWRDPFDVVFLCVKSYDTAWAAPMMAAYLARSGFMVSMQNGMNEATIAAVVGPERTLGVVVNALGVDSPRAGLVARTTRLGGVAHVIFRVGEPDGAATTRARDVAHMLNMVDSAEVTSNLMGERWSKLVSNSISHGLSAVTGLSSAELLASTGLRLLTIKLAAEGIAVGRAMGYSFVDVYGIAPATWSAAATGDAQSYKQVEVLMLQRLRRFADTGRPSVAQDLLRGRRTEIDFTNGHIVASARALNVAAPIQEAILALVHRVERHEISSDPKHVDPFLA